MTSAIPQDNYLGLFLFILYINENSSVTKSSRILMYADDVKLLPSFNAGTYSCGLESDLDNFVAWCSFNFMGLNIEKYVYNILIKLDQL